MSLRDKLTTARISIERLEELKPNVMFIDPHPLSLSLNSNKKIITSNINYNDIVKPNHNYTTYLAGSYVEGLTSTDMDKEHCIEVNGEKINFAINFEYEKNDDGEEVPIRLKHLRIVTINLSSKQDCYEAIDQILGVIKVEYGDYPKDGTKKYEDMTYDELCRAIYNDTYENVVAELWGHVRVNDIPGFKGKAEEADIDKDDQTKNFRSEVEKDVITDIGGGNANWIGDGPEDDD